MPVPTSIFPVNEQASLIGRELTSSVVAPALVTIPVAGYEPEDLATWLDDKSMRGSLVPTYDTLQGPIWAGHTIPTSFVYPDTFGHPLLNLFGDYTSTGQAAAPNTTINNGPGYPAGTTGSITVVSGTSFTNGMWIQIDSGTLAEIVQITGSTATTVVINANTPTRFAHANAATVTNTTAAYTHVFSTQGPAYASGQPNGQPPSHTWVHRTLIPGTANHLAVQYLYWCLSDITLNFNAMGACVWSGKSLSWDHAYPTVTPTVSPSAVRGQPAWRFIAGLAGPASGGTQVLNIAEAELTFARVLEEYVTGQGSQNPYLFGRGPLGGTFKLVFSPAIDETALTFMLANTQPQMQIIQSNGVGGAGQQSIQIDAQLAAFKRSKLSAAKNMFGFDVDGELIGNATNVGNSGGFSVAKITLVNAVPSY